MTTIPMARSGSPGWVLALHSSTDVLGVALQQLGSTEPSPSLKTFPLGRGLANSLLICVEEVLPAQEWSQLARLAVATGPGGFTGTRLTVAMARILSQQRKLPLDGISSFHLIAQRHFGERCTFDPIILSQDLPRHGVVAGRYRPDPLCPGGVEEMDPPRLYRSHGHLMEALGHHAHHPAQPLLPADVAELLAFSQDAARRGVAAPWASVLPLYPTSPVEMP